MYFDALTTQAVRDELRERVLGGRVQRVLILGPLSLGLEIYAHQQRHYLLALVHPQRARVHLASAKLRQSQDSPSPLVLLLRKWVRGARLVEVDQPPWERILRLDFVRRHPREGTLSSSLILEIMGRHSNMILVDETETILDCARRVTPQMTRYRTLLPGCPYVPPPPQPKIMPDELTPAALGSLLGEMEDDDPLWKGLVSGVAGVSPILALEIAHRALGDARAKVSELPSVDALMAAFRRILSDAGEGRWQPTLAIEGGDPAAFAPYELTQYSQLEDQASMSLALEAFYADDAGGESYEGRKAPLRQAIESGRKRLKRKCQSLERSLPDETKIERLRKSGEWILASASQIAPRQAELVVEAEEGFRIPLDPARTPAENAQRYFKEYRKAKAAAREVPPLLAKVDVESRFLDQVELDLDMADNPADIQEVGDELVEAGYIAPQRRGRRVRAAKAPLEVRSADGFRILVGRSSRENDAITFRRARGDDLWLHARGVPGAHVVVLTEGREVPESTLIQAAGLAAHFSQARHAARVEVDCTRRRHVRRITGGRPGMVTYREEKTIRVAPTPPQSGDFVGSR